MVHRSRPRSAQHPRAASRGFTLVELMVVVIIIAIVSALALPTMIQGTYDRRVFTDAATLGELVRQARVRAVGRGAAELVAIKTDSTTNALTAQMFESVTGDPSGGGTNTPVSACSAPTIWPTNFWVQGNAINSAGGTANFVDQVAFDGGGGTTLEGRGQILARMVYPYSAVNPVFIADNTPLYLCFTPVGHTYISTSGQPTGFTTMGSLLGIQFTRQAFPATLTASSTNIIRTLMVPPTGGTRITSH